MTLEILILVLGILFILFAIISKNTMTRIALGIIGVILIIYGGYTFGTTQPVAQLEQADVGNKLQIELPINKVQVISPIEGDSVKCRILTMGVYPDSHDKDIWVLVKPSDDKYYPQSDHTNTSYKRDGEWQVITRFGGDKGELIEIVVYETDSIASQYFSATIEKWKTANSYPGLEIEDIPLRATEIDRLSVALKENCRGVN